MALIGNESTDVFFSAVSGWEIAIKYELGRLQLPEDPARFIPPRLTRDSISVLPIDLVHTLKAGALPLYHKDPFDRLLIAQALAENLTLVSVDSVFPKYGVNLLDA